MIITTVESVIAAAGIVSECLLLIAWITGRKRRFRSLALYACYHLAFSVAMRVLHLRRHQLSAELYYGDEAIDFWLLTAVIIELFIYTASSLPSWMSRVRKDLALTLGCGVSLAILLVASLQFKGFTRTEAWDDRADLLTSLLLCTFLLITAWLTVRLKLHRSATVSAIGWGLTFWVGITLIVDLWEMNASWLQSPIFDEASDASWVAMILSWAYLIFAERTTDRSRSRSSS